MGKAPFAHLRWSISERMDFQEDAWTSSFFWEEDNQDLYRPQQSRRPAKGRNTLFFPRLKMQVMHASPTVVSSLLTLVGTSILTDI
jgi:hypothetical protein